MCDELLDRVRAVDPLPEGSTAPPFESVFAPLADVAQRHARHRRRRLLGLLVPAVSFAVVIGVMVMAVTLLHADRNGSRQHVAAGNHHSPNATTETTSAPTPSAPAGGMSGVVTVWGAGFNSAGAGVISLQQCLRCAPNGNQTRHSTDTEWLLTTRDGGRSWTRSVRGYYLRRPLLAGQDGWAGGLQMQTRSQAGPAAWEPGSGFERYFVTHDGGHSWSVGPSTAPSWGGSPTSLVGGEVWAVGLSDEQILHSPAPGTAWVPTTGARPHSACSKLSSCRSWSDAGGFRCW